MITAIFVVLLMASVSALIFNLSGKMVKTTTTQFQREQAVLYAKSYTEYAVMAIMANDRNGTGQCLQTINGNIGNNPADGEGYNARAELRYIGNPDEVDACSSSRVLSNAVTTTKTPLSVLIDVYINYKDPDDPNGPWHTYHERTLQKI